MPNTATETPVLLIKKMGGVVLLLLGLLLTALGYSNGSNGVATLGFVLLAGGVALLVLKILRRNEM
jgi:hypothetical protein